MRRGNHEGLNKRPASHHPRLAELGQAAETRLVHWVPPIAHRPSAQSLARARYLASPRQPPANWERCRISGFPSLMSWTLILHRAVRRAFRVFPNTGQSVGISGRFGRSVTAAARDDHRSFETEEPLSAFRRSSTALFWLGVGFVGLVVEPSPAPGIRAGVGQQLTRLGANSAGLFGCKQTLPV